MTSNGDPLGFLEDRRGKVGVYVKTRGRDVVKYMTIEELHAWAKFQRDRPRRGKPRTLDTETEHLAVLVYLGARTALEDKSVASLRGSKKVEAVTDRIALAVHRPPRRGDPFNRVEVPMIPKAARDRIAAAVEAALDYGKLTPAVLARNVVIQMLNAEGVNIEDGVIQDLVRPKKLDQA